MLDVGTDRQSLLDDPLYLGYRHPRVRGEQYQAFIDKYISTALRLYPNALLHWEDFERGQCALDSQHVSIVDMHVQRRRSGHGSGRARRGDGRAESFRRPNARPTDRHFRRRHRGLRNRRPPRHCDSERRSHPRRDCSPVLVRRPARPAGRRHGEIVATSKEPYARPAAEVAQWDRDAERGITLEEVVRRVQPTILIGSSGVTGAFGESIVRLMAKGTPRPVILPLSNPTALAEAVPADLIHWTDGKALIATGSPFRPVIHDGATYFIANPTMRCSSQALVWGRSFRERD